MKEGDPINTITQVVQTLEQIPDEEVEQLAREASGLSQRFTPEAATLLPPTGHSYTSH